MLCRLITFDVTNTLLKFRIQIGEQYARVGQQYGATTADPVRLTAAFRRHWKTMNVEQPNFGANFASTTAATWWKTIVSRTFESSDCQLNADQLNRISDHLFALYGTSACWDVRTGTRDVLAELKLDGQLRLGVISNFDHRLHDVLADTGLLPFFDFVLASRDVKIQKPQTEIFDLALDRCNEAGGGATCLPGQALHVGDDVMLDYLAARQAGWNALLLRDVRGTGVGDVTTGNGEVDPAHIVGDIRQVLSWVRQ